MIPPQLRTIYSHSTIPSVLLVSVLLALVALSGCSTHTSLINTGRTADTTVQEYGCDAISQDTPLFFPPEQAPESLRDISMAPEGASGYRTDLTMTYTDQYAVTSANPLATKAACDILAQGGTAADAVVAAQVVLGLVEPQSSGLGGGAFLLYYDARTKDLTAYDARETAPAAADENYLRWVSDQDQREPAPNTRASGRSSGVPGVVKLLSTIHQEHGRAEWKDLFSTGILLAEQGFALSPRMAALVADEAENLALDEQAAAYLLNTDGTPKAEGTLLTNPAYAETLTTLVQDKGESFYTGQIAQDIVDAVNSTDNGATPGKMTLEDLSTYSVIKREPVCSQYRGVELCSMPPPSSGGLTVAQTLGILNSLDLAGFGPKFSSPANQSSELNGGIPQAEAIHLITEAERLAYADRDTYIADPDQITAPGGSFSTLLDPEYLAQRAALIDPARSMGEATPGQFDTNTLGQDTTPEKGTSHVNVMDQYGNIAALTTTIESAFGSFRMTHGFFLNNELSDFSADPTDDEGQPLVNRIDGGKRPRSSMAPTIIFTTTSSGQRGEVLAAVGSPGGGAIIQYIVKTVIGIFDWKLTPQQAISMMNFGSSNSSQTVLGNEHPDMYTLEAEKIVHQLEDMGHEVVLKPQVSGLSFLTCQEKECSGGVDPRREGQMLGGSQ